jgi:glutaredoxin
VRTPRVLLVSKSECPLCDEAKHALEVVGGEIPFAMEVRSIDDDSELRAAHALEVPVVFIDGKKRFFGKVSPLLLRRELRAASGVPSSRVKVFIGVGVAFVIALGVATAAGLVHRRRVTRTEELLRVYVRVITPFRGADSTEADTFWIIDSELRLLADAPDPGVSDFPKKVWASAPAYIEDSKRPFVVQDAWGNPVIFRQPGPVHRRGFDLYSVGPNGIDEHGGGDDIVVGEDVAPVAS